MSFLGYLIHAHPPLNLGLMLRLTCNHFHHCFKHEVDFLKVTRVRASAPNEVHPYDLTDRRYLPSWR